MTYDLPIVVTVVSQLEGGWQVQVADPELVGMSREDVADVVSGEYLYISAVEARKLVEFVEVEEDGSDVGEAAVH